MYLDLDYIILLFKEIPLILKVIYKGKIRHSFKLESGSCKDESCGTPHFTAVQEGGLGALVAPQASWEQGCCLSCSHLHEQWRLPETTLISSILFFTSTPRFFLGNLAFLSLRITISCKHHWDPESHCKLISNVILQLGLLNCYNPRQLVSVRNPPHWCANLHTI